MASCQLRAPGSGTVTDALMTIGRAVKATDVLVAFDAGGADAELAKAKAELEYEAGEFSRKERVMTGTHSVSESEVELARVQLAVAKAHRREAERAVDATMVRAPFDGVVGRCDVQPGETVQAGQPLVTLVRGGPPRVAFYLPQEDVGRVGVGLPVSVTWAGGGTADAVVDGVAPVLDPTTRTQQVTARLATDRPELLGGMGVDVTIGVPPRAAAPADPFPFAVPFEVGASQFEPNDRITVTEVRGTTADMAGGIYRVRGTYTLASRDSATLAGSVTARDAADGVGPWNAAQQVSVRKGSGTFTLLLPVSIRGWPHVSFYDGTAFGGVYFGTGDSVLRKWWGEK